MKKSHLLMVAAAVVLNVGMFVACGKSQPKPKSYCIRAYFRDNYGNRSQYDVWFKVSYPTKQEDGSYIFSNYNQDGRKVIVPAETEFVIEENED